MRLSRSLIAGASVERAYTLVELLGVMVVLGVVLAAVTTAFVHSSTAELELNRRFQAQLNARLGLERLRRDAHCASTVTPTGGPVSTVTLTLPTGCAQGAGTVTWCTSPVGASGDRFGLYRVPFPTCSQSSGVRVADYLTLANAFTYTKNAGQLGRLRVDLRVDIEPSKAVGAYELIDELVLRNGTR